jgi:hypothetical protein
MRHIDETHQSDAVSILATLVTGLDEDEEPETILNYLDLIGRQALLDDQTSPNETYLIVRIGDEEDGDQCGKWIRTGSVTARNEVQAMSLARQAQIGTVRDGMFAVRAADWPEGDDPEPDDNVLIALTLLVTNPGIRAYLEEHDPALLRQARNAMYVASGLLPFEDDANETGGAS